MYPLRGSIFMILGIMILGIMILGIGIMDGVGIVVGDGMIHGTTTIIIADGIILHTITMAARHTLLAELQEVTQTDTTASVLIPSPLAPSLPAIVLQASHLLPQDRAQAPAEEE